MSESERAFYRRLLLKRYQMLLEKADGIYKFDDAVKSRLRQKILSLDWVDSAVDKLAPSAPTANDSDEEE
jgi:hypothetical protein